MTDGEQENQFLSGFAQRNVAQDLAKVPEKYGEYSGVSGVVVLTGVGYAKPMAEQASTPAFYGDRFGDCPATARSMSVQPKAFPICGFQAGLAGSNGAKCF
ncbi:MAG: hypothetical protein P4M00_00740 [Azospirillaceae bacterium]|nr:hypothetical protein [Azospirillaceae bacterium]